MNSARRTGVYVIGAVRNKSEVNSPNITFTPHQWRTPFSLGQRDNECGVVVCSRKLDVVIGMEETKRSVSGSEVMFRMTNREK